LLALDVTFQQNSVAVFNEIKIKGTPSKPNLNKHTMSITEGPQARKLIVDRYPTRDRLLEALYCIEPKGQVIFLHGVTGNGKSILLQDFRSLCSKKVSRAQMVEFKELPLRERIEAFKSAQTSNCFPVGYFDFSSSAFENLTTLSILSELRRMLETDNLRFPLFEFALLQYLRISHRLTKDSIKQLVPPRAVDFTALVTDLLTQTKVGSTGKLLFNLYQSKLNEWWTDYSTSNKISEDEFDEIQEMQDSDIYKEFPRFFAKDINRARNTLAKLHHYPRIVLIFDSHDSIVGNAELDSDFNFYARDEWLRRLIHELDLEAGVVILLSGQQPPQWANASKYKIEVPKIELIEVGALASDDAMDYLSLAGITDERHKAALVEFASVSETETHPLLLGLAADVALQSPKSMQELLEGEKRKPTDFENAAKILIERFLRYTDAETQRAVKALSVCRTFDWSIYENLGQEVKFTVTSARFGVLTGYSFVSELRPSTFAIHSLLRRLIASNDSHLEFVKQVETALLQYFHEKFKNGDTEAEFEELYFKNRLDPSDGINLWRARFDESLARGDIRRCETLVNLSLDFIITNPFDKGLVSQTEGRFYYRMGRYFDAIDSIDASIKYFSEITDATLIRQTYLGLSKATKGQVLIQAHRYRDAIHAILDSNVEYQNGLETDSSNPAILANLASNYMLLGQSHFRLSEYEDAEAAFNVSRRMYSELQVSHSNIYTVSLNIAILAGHEVELAVARSNYQRAIEIIQIAFETLAVIPAQSVEEFAELKKLLLIQESVLAKSLRSLGQLSTAESHLKRILLGFNSLVERCPTDSTAWMERDNVLRELSLIQSTLDDLASSKESLVEALNSFERAKDSVLIPKNLEFCESTALIDLSNICRVLNQGDEGLGYAMRASYLADDSIQTAPLNPQAWLLKAEACKALAQTHIFICTQRGDQTGLNENVDLQNAQINLSQAETSFSKALDLAPRNVDILLNYGALLSYIGQEKLRNSIEGAQYDFLQAMKLFELAENEAPNNAHIVNNLGRGMYELASRVDPVKGLSLRIRTLRQSKSVYYKAKTMALQPLLDGVRLNLVECCVTLGESFHRARRKHKAIKEFKEALKLARLINKDFRFYQSVSSLENYAQDALSKIGKP
jgi:tetratricopeptide (TPR) repeat protein